MGGAQRELFEKLAVVVEICFLNSPYYLDILIYHYTAFLSVSKYGRPTWAV